MEKVAYELYRYLSLDLDVALVKWTGRNRHLVVIFLYLLTKSISQLLRNNFEYIYVQDGLLSPLGLLLKKLFHKKIMITIHGLDITYKNRLYQLLIPKCVSRLDSIICVSQATKMECIKRGISVNKIKVIPNGVSDEFYTELEQDVLISELETYSMYKLRNNKIIFTAGRLVERKGIHWFIENVIPPLLVHRDDIIYLVAGRGICRAKIDDLIGGENLNGHILMLDEIDNKMLKLLYNVSDVFIIPNIPVEGDMEGFGIVALEASSCGTPVIASNLEGLTDAVKDMRNGLGNGFLVEPYDVSGFVNKINKLLNENYKENYATNIRSFTLGHYSWRRIADEYAQTFKFDCST